MAVFRKIERFADPQTSRTPAQKEPDPPLGHDLIPGERYTSTEFAKLEWEKLWTKVWNMGCREEDIANPGDYVVTELGNESIVLTRDEDGGVNAFYNVCSHRGNQVAYGECGHVKTFKCSYHLWEYNLKGQLLNVPDVETFQQGAPCEKLSIRTLKCDTWGGFVWFNMFDDCEPLQEFLGMIPEHLDPYRFQDMAMVRDVTVEWNCNWKASVDAFNEAYHVLGTHPQLATMLEDYDVQVDCYERHNRYLIPFACVTTHDPDGAQITPPLAGYAQSYGFDVDAYVKNGGDGLGLRRALQQHLRKNDKAMGYDFSQLNDDQLTDDYHYMIFPNITLNIHCNSFMLFRQRPHPTDPNKMYFDVQNYVLVPEGQPKPERPQHVSFKYGEDTLGEVLDQDASNLGMVQRGMNSRGFRGLWISHKELRVRHLHKTVDDYIYRSNVKWVK